MNVMNNPRVVVMVVARMGSTRVPGKSLIDLCGHPVLWHVLRLAKEIRSVSDVCLATTDLPADDPIAELARAEGVECYRGDAERVLDRLYGAATQMKADVIVDVGGDCPLLDPEIISRALEDFFSSPCDYLCNYEPPTFPEGMDINIVSMAALEKAWRYAIAPSQRIHPFSYLTYHPESFVIRNYAMTPDLSQHHWSLDFPEDITLIRAAYDKLWKDGSPMRLQDLLSLLATDETFAGIDKNLQRTKVAHAFWNSPGIIRDMHTDIIELTRSAHEKQEQRNYSSAKQYYSEVLRIVERLHREAPG